ncbi:hypothetical protein ACFL2K_05015 [Candidatus Margulisiibacteriota bacterium]
MAEGINTTGNIRNVGRPGRVEETRREEEEEREAFLAVLQERLEGEPGVPGAEAEPGVSEVAPTSGTPTEPLAVPQNQPNLSILEQKGKLEGYDVNANESTEGMI